MSLASLSALRAIAQASAELVRVSPWAGMNYTQFVASIGVELTPAQRVIALVAYDGLNPCDLRGDLRDLARLIFGEMETIPDSARRVLVAVCGGRGGKTYTLAALRILHLAVTVSLTTLAPGEQAIGLVVAPRKELSRQCLRYIRGAVRKNPKLAAMVVADTTDTLVLQRPDGQVSLEAVAASSGGISLRGRSLVGAVLDECAFFHDEDYQVNDVELFRAVMPRVLPGGQTILCSTPWAEAGLLYDEFVANHPAPQCAAPNYAGHGTPSTAIAVHAPTLLLRDNDPEIVGVVESETIRDEINAGREYGARFLTAGTGLFFDSGAVGRCGIAGLVLPAALTLEPHLLTMGADLGFTSDCAACAVIERTATRARLVDVLELTPTAGPLKPSSVYTQFAAMAKARGITAIVADQYYAESANEALWEEGLVRVNTPAGQSGKGDMFTVARRFIHEGRLELPNQPKILQQFREVQSRPTPGGGMTITQPRKGKGGHGDIVSAIVAGLWYSMRLELPKALEVVPADPCEAQALEWQRRIEGRIDRDAARAKAGFGGGVRYDVDDPRDPRSAWGRR